MRELNEPMKRYFQNIRIIKNGQKSTSGDFRGIGYMGRSEESEKKPYEMIQKNDLVLFPYEIFGTSGLYLLTTGKSALSVFDEFFNKVKSREVKNYLYNIRGRKTSPDDPLNQDVNCDYIECWNWPRGFNRIWINANSQITEALNMYMSQNGMTSSCIYTFAVVPMKNDFLISDYEGCYFKDDIPRDQYISKLMDFEADASFGQAGLDKFDIPKKYLVNLDGGYYFTNIIPENYYELFYNIPNTTLWQRMDHRMIKHLSRIEELKIRYAKVDNPRFFTKTIFQEEFVADSVDDIVNMSVLLATDLNYLRITESWNKGQYKLGIKRDEPYTDTSPQYDALQFEMHQYDSVATVVLSQEELGILRTLRNGVLRPRFRFDDMYHFVISNRTSNNFVLLNLVEDISKLQKSKNRKNRWQW